MVEVFKTNVQVKEQAKKLLGSLIVEFSGCKINIDMADCDKVLRIESNNDIDLHAVINFVKQRGFNIEVLPD